MIKNFFVYFLLFHPCYIFSTSDFSTKEIVMIPSNLSYFQQYEPDIFRFWQELSPNHKDILSDQLQQIPIDILERQKKLVAEQTSHAEEKFESFNDFAFSGNTALQAKGQQLIEEGRLGCLLLAGGQGTRLQHTGPKGTYPISVIHNKSLFQLCAEKIKAASQQAKRPLQLAIMTGPDNDEETRLFFQTHAFFGLDPTQISFFIQGELPLLNAEGHLFLQTPNQIAEGSDGNGHSLLSFAQSGILDQWLRQGVEYLHVILVDNPLADPFDAELLGFHCEQQAEITLKCTEKTQPSEKVGLLVKQNERYSVIEYTEMSDQEKEARRPDGRLKHCCANLSLFCFSLSFIQDMVATQQHLPLHKAWKASPYVNAQGVTQLSHQPNAWKFETFIFDWLLHARQVRALIYPREECFAPLKNFTGADSPESVRAALQRSDIRILQAITGLTAPQFPFELAAEFYYPTPELLEKWKGKEVFHPYLEP